MSSEVFRYTHDNGRTYHSFRQGIVEYPLPNDEVSFAKHKVGVWTDSLLERKGETWWVLDERQGLIGEWTDQTRLDALSLACDIFRRLDP